MKKIKTFFNFRGHKEGLTLIETVVSIGIFVFVLLAISVFISMFYRSQSYSWQQTWAVDEARKGIETMTKELREAHEGDDGSYALQKASDKEIIFFSDIDKDEQTERVRYFWGERSSGNQIQECFTNISGGSCSVSFSNFFTGTLISAQLKISLEGDLGSGNEYAEIFSDGGKLGNFCQSNCSDCAASWQGTAIYDVTEDAADNFIQLMADATSRVDAVCDWVQPNHSIKVRFELDWFEEVAGAEGALKKGVIEPTSEPVQYALSDEQVVILSYYVRNTPPIFEYFDAEGNKIIDDPARLADTKLIKIFLIVDYDVDGGPPPYELESSVRLRNLKSQ